MTNSIPDLILPSSPRKLSKKQREHFLVTVTVVLIIIAWVIGYFANGTDSLEYANQVIPGAVRIKQSGAVFIGYGESAGDVRGYAAVGQASGYGGPIKVMVGIDLDGNVLGLQLIENRKTPGFFRLIESNNYLDQFLAADIYTPLKVGEDIDGISGATLSAEGIAAAAREAVRTAANHGLNTSLPAEKKTIKFVPQRSF